LLLVNKLICLSLLFGMEQNPSSMNINLWNQSIFISEPFTQCFEHIIIWLKFICVLFIFHSYNKNEIGKGLHWSYQKLVKKGVRVVKLVSCQITIPVPQVRLLPRVNYQRNQNHQLCAWNDRRSHPVYFNFSSFKTLYTKVPF